MNTKVFALVDCNNFYASCEKLFRPDLVNTPVVVLSNNDGCVVARSKEAKKLGIKTGVPLFKVRHLIQKYGIKVFSSNYALYADISQRVMNSLQYLAPRVEVYSIDEAFLDLTGVIYKSDLTEFGLLVRHTIKKNIGITVCVGIAPTKTLAKLANHAAKMWHKTGGVVDLTSKERQRKLMALLPVNEVWGIGRKLTKRLQQLGITTALQLADSDAKFIREHFSVVVARTVSELNGVSCIALEEIAPTKQQIISSRSFGERITDKQQMREAISEYISRACTKLRQEQQQAKHLTLFLHTSHFSDTEPAYSASKSTALTRPSSDTRLFLASAMTLLDGLWVNGYRYAKAGVMLADFYDPDVYQAGLFDDAVRPQESTQKLMQLIDTLNAKQPKTIWFASQGTKQDWSMKRELLSPAYTTNWLELPVVK
ncbi:translesion error-prone DNA polymerase V subunit UmuC [Rheinheimera sp. MMS21-TC3]|uniref:translesion error-prone DNA polymerase V subunit UmuC n=1 Tax=Rheinheimera sp. MMS21-TC3 TaxID=3072790 RepID=UPI0028C3C6E4|nr:translesion error-prone DNA polymerase V subunit UmuC [Rheinheimera sp. MMS21-TC3]WNO61082.1 translesion error-prone DNA polymerase V subunit UmuC [Rheinheimera sp. MMS21-TC3]